MVVRTLGRLTNATEFNNIIVANRGGYPIRIKDIGEVVDSVEEPRSLARLDGQPAVSVMVQKQSGTNIVKVTDDVKAKLNRVRAALPPDVQIEVTRDQSRFVKKSIEEVKFHLLAGRGAGVGHDSAFHSRLANHDHRHARHPHVDRADVRFHVLHGLYAQQHHDVGADPGDRHRDR